MLTLITDNLLNPPVLFFVLGIVAVLVKSDLELPGSTPKLLALYLLFCIGLHGGVSLAQSGISLTVALSIVAAVVMSCLTAVVVFLVLRPRPGLHNAAAIGATYGSVSAVTFMTAGNFLTEIDVPYNGHMVAALAFMESPAIVAGLLCLRVCEPATGKKRGSLPGLAIESLLHGSVFLLLGSLVVGYLSGESGWDKVSPFAEGIFGGALCLFLLDMGISAGRGLGGIRQAGAFPVVFGLAFPFRRRDGWHPRLEAPGVRPGRRPALHGPLRQCVVYRRPGRDEDRRRGSQPRPLFPHGPRPHLSCQHPHRHSALSRGDPACDSKRAYCVDLADCLRTSPVSAACS